MKREYVPSRGDLVWVDFSPPAGHEQSGRRPALVISPAAYNQKVVLALLCPITSHPKGYPFEVNVASRSEIRGVVLADQIRNLDWRSRRAESIGVVLESTLAEVLAKLQTLVGAEG